MATAGEIVAALHEQVRHAAVNKPARAFIRQHIFHDILCYCGQGEAHEQRLDMMFRFNQFEKCVLSVRRRQPGQTGYWLAAMHASELHLATELARVGMDAMYYPAMALKDYADGNHAAALTRLDLSLARFVVLFQYGFGEAVLGLVEQNLNKVRVLVTANRPHDAIAVTLALFGYLCGERSNAAYQWQRLADYCGAHEQASMVAYYIDEVLIKFLDARDTTLVDRLLLALDDQLDGWLPGNIRNAFGLLRQLRRQPAGLDAWPVDLARLPVSVQCILITALRGQAGCEALQHFLALSPTYKRMAQTRWRAAPAAWHDDDRVAIAA